MPVLPGVLRSILYWIVPWGSASMRLQPVFTFMVFTFHFTLLAVPLFLGAHNILWDEAFGISLWSMPDLWADVMSVILLVSIIFLIIRRIVRSEVRILTGAWDYILLGTHRPALSDRIFGLPSVWSL